MINYVKLKNFRKHTDTKTSFTGGLQVLRGQNEAGKSTNLESICYALFGTSALRTSLDDTVTWGQPVGSLKVECSVTIDDIEYIFTRSKSGAEIHYGVDGFVSGQRETKAFAETLLGCSADVASLLIMADQNAVRGVLSKGAGDSSSLVEKLADLGVIETLIDKVQDQLPSGNTKSLEGEIAALQTLADQPLPAKPVDLVTPALAVEVESWESKLEALQTRQGLLDQQALKATVVLDEAKAVAHRNNTTAARIRLLEGIAKPVATVSVAELDEVRTLHASANAVSALRKERVKVFPKASAEWEGTAESLDAEIAKTQAEHKRAEAEVAELSKVTLTLKLDLQKAQLLRINEDTCAFCKKDLTQVPEVVSSQLAADAEISKFKGLILANGEDLLKAKLARAEAAETLATLQEIKSVTARVFELAGENWLLDWTSLPPKASWVGTEPPAAGDELPDLKSLEAKHATFLRETAAYEAAQAELATLKLEPEVNTAEALGILELAKEHMEQVREAEAGISMAKHKLAMAQQEARAAQATWERSKQDWANAQASLATKKDLLSETVKHNELVKRLREARPKISALMWGTVLGAVSHYFSQIRGVPSVVTRSDAGFLVDGKGVTGLSGSTLDALGLAIRIALAKMFLPTVPFLFLDESFSGADETRELAGLATVAGCGFDQVILVTHRDAADALAANLVQL